MGIGAYISDAVIRMIGSFSVKGSNTPDGATVAQGGYGCLQVSVSSSAEGIKIQSASATGNISVAIFDNQLAVPTAPENSPASISAYFCIKY
jgi:hypothetical protein